METGLLSVALLPFDRVDTIAGITIRRITAQDGPALRDLRLRSITDSPAAFGQLLAEASARPDLEWLRSARQAAKGDDRIWLIAEASAETLGLVQGRKRRPATLLLFSMWVDPTARRSGVGRMLIEGLEAWASGWDAVETILWVVASNRSAIDFYRDLGFEPLSRGQDADAGARFGAIAMRRGIHSPSP